VTIWLLAQQQEQFGVDHWADIPALVQERVIARLGFILVPAFNARSTRRGTFWAAIRPTWQPNEIIILNDGSGDGPGAIAEAFESRGVKVLTQSSAAASAARYGQFSLSSR